ncbi:hypothetical protein QQ045_020721 [Rhodiola kirilowii]
MTGFKNGDRVEVSSKQQGFIGSYFEAKIINFHGPHDEDVYTVCYKDLLKDDKSGPLLEPTHSSEIRPYPPTVTVEYRVGDVADAFANDGWWVGVLVEIRDGFGYVRFDDYNKIVVAYPMSKIRIHLDWEDDDKWSITSVREQHRIKNVQFQD